MTIVFVSIVYTYKFKTGIFLDQKSVIQLCQSALIDMYKDLTDIEMKDQGDIYFRHKDRQKPFLAGVFPVNPQPGSNQLLFATWGDLKRVAISILPERQQIQEIVSYLYPSIKFSRMPIGKGSEHEFYCRYPYLRLPLEGSRAHGIYAPDYFIQKNIVVP